MNEKINEIIEDGDAPPNFIEFLKSLQLHQEKLPFPNNWQEKSALKCLLNPKVANAVVSFLQDLAKQRIEEMEKK